VVDASDDSGLVPIYIDRRTRRFSGNTITYGARGDSYYEYLIKYWVQGGGRDDTLKDQYLRTMRSTVEKLIQQSEPSKLTFVGELIRGRFDAKMDHLVCFLPGVLALGHTFGAELENDQLLNLAEEIAYTCYQTYARTPTGLAPEITRFRTNKDAHEDLFYQGSEHNLLRPETLESLFVLSRVTGKEIYKQWGWEIFEAFEKHTKIPSGGYSNIANVFEIPVKHRDKMETFFLGETLKYAYLLMADEPGDASRSVIDLKKVVFNTEAHPFPIVEF
jgi:endoplasmic reticulum Man9GlcNAc2 1,2-alpha-mannosidase